MLLEGAGERAQNAFERYPHAPNDLQALVRLQGVVPTVAVVMGASAGHGALTAPLMDFVVMVEGAALFSAGPPLVAAATGEEVSKEELGGAAVHTTISGRRAQRRAPTMPPRSISPAGTSATSPTTPASPLPAPAGDGPRRLDAILDVVPADPRRPYDVRRVVELLADDGDVLEIQPAFGRAIVTALVRLGGAPVAVVANNPAVKAGAIDRGRGGEGGALPRRRRPVRAAGACSWPTTRACWRARWRSSRGSCGSPRRCRRAGAASSARSST